MCLGPSRVMITITNYCAVWTPVIRTVGLSLTPRGLTGCLCFIVVVSCSAFRCIFLYCSLFRYCSSVAEGPSSGCRRWVYRVFVVRCTVHTVYRTIDQTVYRVPCTVPCVTMWACCTVELLTPLSEIVGSSSSHSHTFLRIHSFSFTRHCID